MTGWLVAFATWVKSLLTFVIILITIITIIIVVQLLWVVTYVQLPSSVGLAGPYVASVKGAGVLISNSIKWVWLTYASQKGFRTHQIPPGYGPGAWLAPIGDLWPKYLWL